LHAEANSLRSRIASTETRFGKLEDLADKDDDLTESAKAKVGQAKTDSENVQKQMQKALESIKAIIGELESMKEISVQDLDLLGKFLINNPFLSTIIN
jgi:chromosome segregation ATPase